LFQEKSIHLWLTIDGILYLFGHDKNKIQYLAIMCLKCHVPYYFGFTEFICLWLAIDWNIILGWLA